jgi:hypothetical protein
MFWHCRVVRPATAHLLLGVLLVLIGASRAHCQTSESGSGEIQPRAAADDLMARFREKEPMIDGRIRIKTASPALKTGWLALQAEVAKNNRLLSLKEFADFVVSNQFPFKDRDYGQLRSLYASIQSPSPEIVDLVDAHHRRWSKILPARYSYTVASHERLRIFGYQMFHDGKHGSTVGRAIDASGVAGYSVTATDGVRVMRFSREGLNCDAPIQIPRVVWKADITPFRGYSQIFHKRDPLRLYFPGGFENTYKITGQVSTVRPISQVAKNGVWEILEDIDGKEAIIVGTPTTYVAFDAKHGDLLLYSSGEYRLGGSGDSNLVVGDANKQNRVLFKDHQEFAGFGRLPTLMTITIWTSITDVYLHDIESADPAGDNFIEEMIPENAYVLDRIRGLKYINHAKEANDATDTAPPSPEE